MPIVEPLLCKNENILSFQLQYTKNHLFWLQFIESKVDLTPKLIHIWEDKVLVFFHPDEFDFAKQNWHKYLVNRKYKRAYHFRILEDSDDLKSLISNWFVNIKDLKVKVNRINNCYQIRLFSPPKLRQFIIGKNGKEIEMLTNFLLNNIKGNYNYQLLIH